MPHRQLPIHPSVVHLRHQARDLMRGQTEGDMAVLQRIREFHPAYRRLSDEEIRARPLKLSDALLTIAREYTFPSWPRLKASVESGGTPNEDVPLEDRIAAPLFREAVRCIDTGDVERLKALLGAHPELSRQRIYFDATNYFGRPSLLQFVANNPIRHPAMPNAVAIASAILDAGAPQTDLNHTLSLVATGRVPREEGVQVPLIDLLCARGAQVQSLSGVLAHGEFEAAEALLRHGGQVTLSVATALGRVEDFQRLLPAASPEERHLALALSAQFGRIDCLGGLLDAGEDPNRYNPPGAHAHSTPLHQAVIHGEAEAVRMLLRAGARRDIPDTLFEGTPLDWAEHAKLPAMVELLRETGESASSA